MRLTGGTDQPDRDDDVCVCGHPRSLHEHYRRGRDCALCGPETCPRFRRA